MLIFKFPLPEVRVSAASPSNEGSAENRRTTRIIHAVPVTIRGTDALGQVFEELTSTVTVNCNGCKYESRHYVPKGSRISVEIGGREPGVRSRKFPARVVWVQRPRTYREIFHIALEFEVPGNSWGIKSPPSDWFPHPDDEELVIPVYSEADEPGLVPIQAKTSAHMQAASHAVSAIAAPAAAPHDITLTLVQPSSPQKHRPEFEDARQMLRTTVEAAMAEDVTMLRQRLETNLRQAVEDTVKSLGDRVADHILKAVVEHATDRTAAIVAGARETSRANVGELDAKVGLAAREAMGAQQKRPRKPPSAKRGRKSPK